MTSVERLNAEEKFLERLGMVSVMAIFRQLPFIDLLPGVLFGEMLLVVFLHLDENLMTAAVRS